MTTYQVAYKASTREAQVQISGQPVPAGYVNIGTFVHDDTLDPLETSENHVIWHHLRDIFYKTKNTTPAQTGGFWPDNVTDINNIKITVNNNIAVTGVTVDANFSLIVGATKQLTPVVAPANATNKAVTYTSADPTKATVSASGLVTAVAAGTSVITVHTTDGNKTATVTATVTAT